MWNFYLIILNSLISQNEILDEFITQACVPLNTFISKNPETFRTGTFDGHQTFMDLMFTFIAKLFNESPNTEDIINDEVDKCCAVTLIITIIENVSGIEPHLPNILAYLANQIN